MSIAQTVAVITYHRHDNYGALLQCYALQNILKELGTNPVVIDYVCAADEYPFSSDALHGRGIKACIFSVFGLLTRLPRRAAFRNFRERLNRTRRIDKNSISELSDCYDCYFTGSDNVWNGEITGWDPNYFLEFVSDCRKRKSYAASFGGDRIAVQEEKKYRKYLLEMDTILVRESTAAALVERITGRRAQVVLDPTLLVTEERWEKIAAPRLIDEKYVLAYQLVPSKVFVEKAEEIARLLHCRLVFVPFPIGKFVKAEWRLKDGPQEWLSLIRHAEYILTDSFHGTVFSVLFHKQFAVMMSQLGTRIENLLQICELQKRAIQFDEIPPLEMINYSPIDAILQRERAESLKNLRKALECEGEQNG